MGTNSKAPKQNYVTAPAAPTEAETAAEPAAEEPSEAAPVTAEQQAAMDSFADAVAFAEIIAANGYLKDDDSLQMPIPEVAEDTWENYQQFAEQVHLALAAVEEMKAAGAPAADIEAKLAELKAQSLAYLDKLDASEMRMIADNLGFEHSALISEKPLRFWINPVYPTAIEQKAKIQMCAFNRYALLQSGETVMGMTLADLHAIEGTPGPDAQPGMWAASPAQVEQLAQEAADSVAAFKSLNPLAVQGHFTAALAAEQKLASAYCPEDPAAAQALQNKVKVQIDQIVGGANFKAHATEAIAAAIAEGKLGAEEAKHLTAAEAVALIRPQTPFAEAELIKARAQERQQQLAVLKTAQELHAKGSTGIGAPVQLGALGGGSAEENAAAQAHVAAWVTNAGELKDLQKNALTWIGQSQHSPQERTAALGPTLETYDLAKAFKDWAKPQPLPELRAVAEKLGMPNPGTASRAHVQDYLVAHFSEYVDKDAVVAKAADAAQKKALAKSTKSAAAATPTSNAPTAAGATPATALAAAAASAAVLVPNGAGVSGASVPPSAAPSSPAAAAAPPARKSYRDKHASMIAALKLAQATHADIPKRVEASEVQGWAFGPGKSAHHLGGSHPKSLHQAPDGSTWMFKHYDVDSTARAQAEAAASHAFHLGGVPAVPVYVNKVNGKTGCIQPMLKNASHLSSDPKSWTQPEVDSMVRYHVAAWLVGDHDGKPENFLRTASGGLVPIDQGQAFKFFGRDKLSLGYSPSNGAIVPVHQRAYNAFLNGGLAEGVTVKPAAAHPVIKQFESIPDSQWRALLHRTAHDGAKAGVTWSGAMRRRAAKSLGKAEKDVTTSEVAEAFLDHACERKNGLRAAFAGFFTKDLKIAAGAALKHGG